MEGVKASIFHQVFFIVKRGVMYIGLNIHCRSKHIYNNSVMNKKPFFFCIKLSSKLCRNELKNFLSLMLCHIKQELPQVQR